jgi:hypothetical protein
MLYWGKHMTTEEALEVIEDQLNRAESWGMKTERKRVRDIIIEGACNDGKIRQKPGPYGRIVIDLVYYEPVFGRPIPACEENVDG